jgi:ComF family protein
MRLQTALAVALDVLLPPSCAGCGLPGDPVCAGCASRLAEPDQPGCHRCGHPWSLDVPTCVECPSAIDVARHAVSYVTPAPAIVAALKDRRLRSLAGSIAMLMAAGIPAPPRGVALVPVPLAPDRRRHRGFNQAELIARELGRAWGRSVATPIERVRETPPQRGSSVTDRRTQVRGAFAPTGERAPHAVCLVDDVHTTGATLTACARALRAGGAARVGAVTFARVTRGRHAIPSG